MLRGLLNISPETPKRDTWTGATVGGAAVTLSPAPPHVLALSTAAQARKPRPGFCSTFWDPLHMVVRTATSPQLLRKTLTQ
ncbi:unnamed protein product [Arctogadus glacialis]